MATKVSKKKAAAAIITEETPEVKKKAAAKKTTTKKKTAKAAAPKKTKPAPKAKKNIDTALSNYPNAYLVLDYPVENEIIFGNHYAIRIGASPDGYVEISFDNGEWQPCRYDAGYWWFDWSYFSQGDHSIAVRLVDPNGNTIIETEPRKCEIC